MTEGETVSRQAPFFSVIIPTYNRARCILDAVSSVQSQTFSDFELLVIDDGSTDNTNDLLQAVEATDQRVKYVYQNNSERSAARNHGIELANGRYICFLDSDDIYLEDHLEKFHQTIVRNDFPKAMILANSLADVNGEYRKDPPYVTETDEPIELVLKISICSQRVCIESSILKKFRYDVNLRVGEDQELWSRIVQYYPIVHSDQYTVVLRDLGDRTIDYLKTETYLANLALKKRILSEIPSSLVRPEWRRFVISSSYYKLAISYLRNDRLLKCYWNLLLSIVTDPSHFLVDKIMVFLSTIPIIRNHVEGRLPTFLAK